MKESNTYSNRPIQPNIKGIQDGIPRGKKKKSDYHNQNSKISHKHCDDAALSINLNGDHNDDCIRVLSKTLNESSQLEKNGKEVTSIEISPEDQFIIQEIKHARRRIKNIQESIQLSTNIAQPCVWEDNCLKAVGKCVNEWRIIVTFHVVSPVCKTCTDSDGGDDDGGGGVVDQYVTDEHPLHAQNVLPGNYLSCPLHVDVDPQTLEFNLDLDDSQELRSQNVSKHT